MLKIIEQWSKQAKKTVCRTKPWEKKYESRETELKKITEIQPIKKRANIHTKTKQNTKKKKVKQSQKKEKENE